MSRWEAERIVDSALRGGDGELMLSGSDVLAWIRANANSHTPHGCGTDVVYHALADALRDSMLAATIQLLDDGSSS